MKSIHALINLQILKERVFPKNDLEPKDWKRLCFFIYRAVMQIETLWREVLQCSTAFGLQALYDVVLNQEKNTNIHDFSKLNFKMKSTPSSTYCLIENRGCNFQWRYMRMFLTILAEIRNKAFPTATGGKGADTSIISAWLEDEMKNMVDWLLNIYIYIVDSGISKLILIFYIFMYISIY